MVFAQGRAAEFLGRGGRGPGGGEHGFEGRGQVGEFLALEEESGLGRQDLEIDAVVL